MTNYEFGEWELVVTQWLARQLESFDDQTEEAERHLKELKKQKKMALDLKKIFDEAKIKRQENQWAHYSNEVLEPGRIKSLREMGHEVTSEQLNNLVSLAKGEAEKSVKDLSVTLPHEFLAAGLPVDDSSRFPKFSVRENYIRIQINDKTLTASVTPANGKAVFVNADVQSILKVVIEEDQRLFNEDFDAPLFVQNLVGTITSLTGLQEKNSTSSISWKEIVKNWVGPKITADELGAQLGLTMRNFHQLLSANGIFFNQEKGSENSLKPYGQTLLVGTMEIRNGGLNG